MYKKTLLSLAVASTLSLTGCLDDGDNFRNADPDYKIEDTNFDSSLTRPLFNPNILADSDTAFPTNYDLPLLLGTTAANYDFTGLASGTDPASNALNDLDGHTTSGQFDIEFNNSLNPATVIKNQTVFVVPLVTEPISSSFDQAIPKALDPSNIDLDGSTGTFGAPFDLAMYADPTQLNVRVEVIDINGGTDNAIRVTPLLPLPAETKFLVFMTDGITGTDGRGIGESKDYTWFKEGNAIAAFDAITSVVQGHDALANAFVGANDAITNKVVMSHFFTTTNPTAVMNAMASPATAFTKTGQQVVLLSALQVVKDESTDPTDTAGDHFAALGAAVADITANPGAPTTELGQKVAAAIGPYLDPTIVPSLASQVVGGAFAANGFFSMPKERASHFYQTTNAATLTAFAGLDDANPLKQAAGIVNVSEGAITLPYYSPLPEGADGTNLITGMWRGNEDLETALNGVITALKANPDYANLPEFSFLRDSDETFNVTYTQPFAQEMATVTVPVTIIHPVTGASPLPCAGISNVAIFQHGITADRSVSLIPAINMAASGCIATIAIDQPLHGLGGATVGLIPGLDVLTQEDIAGSAVDGADHIGERHFMFSDTSGTLTPELQTDITNVSSGSLAINIKSLQTTRDSLRQAAMDLLNLNSSIGSFDFNSGTDVLAGLPVHFIGHSLGGIAGTPYAAINNNAVVRGSYAGLIPLGEPGTPPFETLTSVSLMNTGGQLTKLGENSPVFSGSIINGLASADVLQGSSSFESFLLVWQGIMDTIDPVNYAIDLGSTTSNLLASEVLNDLRVPNEANVNPLGNALSAPLASTEPLMALLDIGAGGTNLSDGSEGLGIIDSDTSPVAGLPGPQASFFANSNPCADASHITFITPVTPPSATDTICPGGSDTSAAFAEMITEVIGLITAGAVPVTANAPALLGKSTTIESALDQNAP